MAIILDAPIEGMTKRALGSTWATIQTTLQEQFAGPFYQSAGSNGDNYATIEDATGDYLRTRRETGGTSAQQWVTPTALNKEVYLQYDIMFEAGFDHGDGTGGRNPFNTTHKLPGMTGGGSAGVGGNVGGSHDPEGFTGRIVTRATRKSDGQASLDREGMALSAYIYGFEIDGNSIASGFGEDYYFLDSHATTPFEGITTGLVNGCGDPRIWDMPTGSWITVTVGYRVDGPTGWFKAWTLEQGVDTVHQERLHIPNVQWMNPANSADEGADGMMFHHFYGGSGAAWYADTESFIRMKNFKVSTTEIEVIGAAVDFAITSPADLATDVTTPVTPSGTAADDGSQGYETSAVVDGQSEVWNPATFTSGTETWVADSPATIPQGGETIRQRARRWS